jgi:pimeloyl-ACP methyl ester carboxylesterase
MPWIAPERIAMITEDHRVPHGQGTHIFVRNVRPEGVARFAPERIVVLQHGATYPSTAFHLPFGGLSWMHWLGQRGFDAWCLDLPGYGRSTRPAALEEPPEKHPPYLRTPEAAAALGRVVDYVRERRGVAQLNIIGWSWGTAISSLYTSQNNDKVARLTLFAPVWHRQGRSAIDDGKPLGAYRLVTRAEAKARKQAGVPKHKLAGLMPDSWFEAWADETFATDPKGGGKTLRAPNGVVLDSREYWSAGRSNYDPAKVTVPLQIVVGEWDNDTPVGMAQTLFPLFVNAPWKRLTLIGEGTHSLLMERNRLLLFRTVQQFLEEPGPGEAG